MNVECACGDLLFVRAEADDTAARREGSRFIGCAHTGVGTIVVNSCEGADTLAGSRAPVARFGVGLLTVAPRRRKGGHRVDVSTDFRHEEAVVVVVLRGVQ